MPTSTRRLGRLGGCRALRLGRNGELCHRHTLVRALAFITPFLVFCSEAVFSAAFSGLEDTVVLSKRVPRVSGLGRLNEVANAAVHVGQG